MSAVELRNVDKSFYISYQAWLNQQVKAEKQKGKKTVPYFKSFDKFFNYKKQEKDAWRNIYKKENDKDENNDINLDFLNLIKEINNGKKGG